MCWCDCTATWEISHCSFYPHFHISVCSQWWPLVGLIILIFLHSLSWNFSLCKSGLVITPLAVFLLLLWPLVCKCYLSFYVYFAWFFRFLSGLIKDRLSCWHWTSSFLTEFCNYSRHHWFCEHPCALSAKGKVMTAFWRQGSGNMTASVKTPHIIGKGQFPIVDSYFLENTNSLLSILEQIFYYSACEIYYRKS